MAFDPAWESGGMQPSVTVNKLGLDLVTDLNAGNTKLANSIGITGGQIEAPSNRGTTSKQPSFADIVAGITNQASSKTVVGGMNYAGSSLSGVQPDSVQTVLTRKGNFVSVRVNDSAYQERIALCQFSLIARIVLSKGDKPWKFDDLYSKLQNIWKLDKWQLISLGRGYFHILLFSAEDRQKVWSFGSLNLKLGIVRIQNWVKNFNPATQKLTNAQIWIRFYNLSWEYWHPRILTDLARGIGIPLRIDNATLAGNYGRYARVLVDVDLAGFVPEKLLLEMTVDCIEVDLYFESFPDFCSSCHSVGHSVAKCRLVIGKAPPTVGPVIGKVSALDIEKENKAPGLNQVYISKQLPSHHIKSNTSSVPLTNAFEVLDTEVTPTLIEDMVHQHDAVPNSMIENNTETGIEAHPSAPNLCAATNRTDFITQTGKSIQTAPQRDQTPSHHSTVPRHVTSWANAFGDTDEEPDNDDYADNIVEDEWPPLQGEGSSKPSNEPKGTPSEEHQSNTMAMVPFDSSSALTAAQRNLDLVASHPAVSKTTDQNLWNLVKRKPGRPPKGETARRLQVSKTGVGLTKPFTRASRHTAH